MKKLLFSFALNLFVFSACLNNTPLSPSMVYQQSLKPKMLEQYYPINTGRRWTYDLVQKQNGVDNTKFKTMTIYTEALSLMNGAERAILHRVYPDASIKPNPSLAQRFNNRVELSRYQPELISNDTSSLLMLQIPNHHPLATGSRSHAFITALKTPLQAGQQWSGRVFQGGTETITLKGIESVTVPVGKFEALLTEQHLQYENGKDDFLRYWYAPGIGMVKMHEEITAYFGQWLKLESDGVLTEFKASL